MLLEPLHLSKACILVLDADPDRRAGLCKLLADRGYRLADGVDGADASGNRIDLVLAGVGPAPGAGHVRLPSLDRAVPVIALIDRAAWLGFDFFDAANELGAVAVLQRPFSRTTLLRLIAAVLADPTGAGTRCESWDEEPAGLAELLRRLENPYPA